MGVVREVARRQADMGRHEAASEVLRAADQPEEAVSVAVAGGAWEKARESARGHGELAEKVTRRTRGGESCDDETRGYCSSRWGAGRSDGAHW